MMRTGDSFTPSANVNEDTGPTIAIACVVPKRDGLKKTGLYDTAGLDLCVMPTCADISSEILPQALL